MIIYEGLLDYIVPALGSTITALASVGIGYLVRYINRKSKSELLHHAMNTLGTVAQNTVSALMQTEVKALKAAAADGKLTDEEKSNMKRKAIETIKMAVADEALDVLKRANTNLDAYLDTLVESTVRNDKLWNQPDS
jgi:hypothetical protein